MLNLSIRSLRGMFKYGIAECAEMKYGRKLALKIDQQHWIRYGNDDLVWHQLWSVLGEMLVVGPPVIVIYKFFGYGHIIFNVSVMGILICQRIWDRSTLIGVKKWDFANYSEFENEDETLEIANFG